MTGEIKVESLKPLVRVIDDDDAMRRSWAFLIEGEGWSIPMPWTSSAPATSSVPAASFSTFACPA
jgi:FixJ family two-component response regulator